MSVTYIVICHKNPAQLKRMIRLLSCKDVRFCVHVDAKSDISGFMIDDPHVAFVPDSQRVRVSWGHVSVVDAELAAMRTAVEAFYTDYYWVVSGQDMPLAPAEKIAGVLSAGNGADYVNLADACLLPEAGGMAEGGHVREMARRFSKRNEIFYPRWSIGKGLFQRIVRRALIEASGGYGKTFPVFLRRQPAGLRLFFGSQWMCLRRETLAWMLGYIDAEPGYREFFEHSFCPDECFFQTLYMASPEAAGRSDHLHYLEWGRDAGRAGPKTLGCSDLDRVFSSGKLMARKFDEAADGAAIDELEGRLRR